MLLLARRGAEPITNLEVGDERASHREGGADHASHDESGEHATGTTQSDGHHDHRGEDERHERHATHGVGAHDGDGVGGYGGEEEGDERHEHDAYEGEEHVAIHHAKPEEDERDDDGEDGGDADESEREVTLGALGHCRVGLSAFHLLGSQSDGALDDAPRLDDADDARHGDASDADALAVGLEDLFRRHVAHGSRDGGVPLVEHGVAPDESDARHDEPPHGERAEADDERIAEADDVAQSEHSGTRVHLEHQFRLVGQLLSPCHDTRGEILVPPSERGDDEVVESAHDARDEQRPSLVATLLARYEHLRGGRGFGEGVFAV